MSGGARSLADRFRRLHPSVRAAIWAGLTNRERAALLHGTVPWLRFWSRDHQRPPPGEWAFWLFLGGRGAGKTRAVAEYVIQRALGRRRIINVCAATADDVRTVCIEGDSGIQACMSPEVWASCAWEPSLGVAGRLTFPNGSVLLGYSASEPERFKGPQCDTWWACDPAAWPSATAQHAWNMGMYGFRRLDPEGARAVIDTTPEDEGLVLNIVGGLPGMVKTHAITDDNEYNLDRTFFQDVLQQFAGTDLERRHRFGELLGANREALIQPAWVRLFYALPTLVKVVVAIDPSAGTSEDSDETGIVVAGVDELGQMYVLADYTGRHDPPTWAAIAVAAFRLWEADCIVAETNRGGKIVRSMLEAVAPFVPVVEVTATRGKVLRAEPLALAYQRGLVHHFAEGPQLAHAAPVELEIVEVVPVGDGAQRVEKKRKIIFQRDTRRWGTLAAEITGWSPKKSRSPNGLDALAWAHAHLRPFDASARDRPAPAPDPRAAEQRAGGSGVSLSWLRDRSPGHGSWLSRGR